MDKLGVRIKKIKNTLLVGFFQNQSKSNIFTREITRKFYREFFCKFLIEIPDFGGNSRRNHPEPEGNFQKFPEGEGDFCEFPT